MRRFAPLIVLTATALTATALTATALTVAAQPASATATAPGTYVPLPQKRVVDTRAGLGVAARGAIAGLHGGKATLAGVPSSAGAVQVAITVASGTVNGGITLWKPGTARPGTTNLIFGVNQTATNTTVAQVLNGQVDYFNTASSGSVQLVMDITGYYLGGTVGGSSGVLHTIPPARVVSSGAGALKTIAPVIAGSGHPIPAGASAAVVDLTVTSPTRAGSITAYATGADRPSIPTLDFAAGARNSVFAVLPLSLITSPGSVTLFNNSAGTVWITVDVLGYYLASVPTTVAGTLQTVPAKALGTHQLAANSSTAIPVNQLDGVPVSSTLVTAVLLGVEAKAPAASGALNAYPGGTMPGVRNLSWAAHTTAINLVLVPMASNGTVTFHNSSSGVTPLNLYVYGYVGATNLTPPVTSPSRYVRNISDSDITAMHAEGAADAAAGAKLVILEFGAQKSDQSGVQLTGPAGTPLTYSNVQAAVQSYLSGFGSHPGVTVAVGTNNDGPGPNNTGWQIFPAASRGARWAQLVDAITPPAGVSVVGADDIESNFFSTEAQAEAWESGYIGATTKTLIFNGSADGCPFTFGGTTACTFGWTMLNYNHLAHSGSRIQAVPQIYNAQQAIQWANIDAVSGGSPITFAGVLTDHGDEPSNFTPAQGYAAAFHALSAVVANPSLPAVTDIHADG